MADPFEARERSFYVKGEMTDFDVAAIQDYLGKTGLRVVEKPLPLPTSASLEILEFELAPLSDVFTKEEFMNHWRFNKERGMGNIWTAMIKSVRSKQLPLEIRRTESNELGVTYESADVLLKRMEAGEYEGKRPTPHARECLRGVIKDWRQAQAATETSVTD